MKEEVYFEEKQRLSHWLVGVVAVLVILRRIIRLIMHNKAITFDRIDDVLITVAILLLIYLICVLKTIINKDGIFIKYFPFMGKYIFISWEDIDNVYVRKYRPILESGGWGIRVSPFSVKMLRVGGFSKTFFSKTQYTAHGNRCLQLELKNGKQIIIGTQRPQDIDEIIKKLYKSAE